MSSRIRSLTAGQFCSPYGVAVPATNHDVAVLSLDTGDYRVLAQGDLPSYATTGHVVFGGRGGGVLWALPFDAERLDAAGEPFPVLEGVRLSGFAGEQFALGRDGTLAYIDAEASLRRTLVWVDMTGSEYPIDVESRAYESPRISPNGERVAVHVGPSDADIWIHELSRSSSSRFTFDRAQDGYALWTLDGARLVFFSNRGGAPGLFWKRADGAGGVELLRTEPDRTFAPSSWTPDGTRLALSEIGPGGYDIGLLTMDGSRTWTPLLHEGYAEAEPAVSPNGEWMAYTSSELGALNVFLRSFPNVDDRKERISTSGGEGAIWSPDGGTLFYRSGDAVMAVRIDVESTLSVGEAEVLFTGDYYAGLGRQYDLSPDGNRFIFVKPVEEGERSDGAPRISVIRNWIEGLEERRCSKDLPGSTRGQGDAPEGCGSGIMSVSYPTTPMRRCCPTTSARVLSSCRRELVDGGESLQVGG